MRYKSGDINTTTLLLMGISLVCWLVI